jgi:hypothetical protein
MPTGTPPARHAFCAVGGPAVWCAVRTFAGRLGLAPDNAAVGAP